MRGELGPVDLSVKCSLLFSEHNSIAQEIAQEAAAMATNSNHIAVENVEDCLQRGLSGDRESFFLLYLNNQVFTDTGRMLEEQLTLALNAGIKIILVHETDFEIGGMKFDKVFALTPRELMAPPYNLYSDMAIKLYSSDEYREISLRLILCKMRDDSNATLDQPANFRARGSMYKSIFRHQ